MTDIPRFKNEKQEAPVPVRRVYLDSELAEFEEEVRGHMREHPGARGREYAERVLCLAGGGRMGEYMGRAVMYAHPLQQPAAADKVEQWKRWHARTFPFDRLRAYDEWHRQDCEVKEAKRSDAEKAVARDAAMRDIYPTEEVNPEDIPF